MMLELQTTQMFEAFSVTVDASTKPITYTDQNGNTYEGFDKFLKGQTNATTGSPLTGGGQSGAKSALQGFRGELEENKALNDSAESDRTAAMEQWNYDNVWTPATQYAESHNSAGETFRNNASESYNASLDEPDGPRQQAADSANQAGDQMYTRNNELNKWSSAAVNWAKSTQTGNYVGNRNQIFSPGGQAAALNGLVQNGYLTQTRSN